MLEFVTEKIATNLSLLPAIRRLYDVMSDRVGGKSKWVVINAALYALASMPDEERRRFQREVLGVEEDGDEAERMVAPLIEKLATPIAGKIGPAVEGEASGHLRAASSSQQRYEKERAKKRKG